MRGIITIRAIPEGGTMERFGFLTSAGDTELFTTGAAA